MRPLVIARCFTSSQATRQDFVDSPVRRVRNSKFRHGTSARTAPANIDTSHSTVSNALLMRTCRAVGNSRRVQESPATVSYGGLQGLAFGTRSGTRTHTSFDIAF